MDHPDGEARQISELNKDLQILATIFPGILPEVFREALQAFSGRSRLNIAVDQLLRNQDGWVKGRWRTSVDRRHASTTTESHSEVSVLAADEFRKSSYKWAVYVTLCQEFRVLNKCAIRAVLAEENHCYSRAREKLLRLATKSWRGTLNAIWTKWRRPTLGTQHHYMITWHKSSLYPHEDLPGLRKTGDLELDAELYHDVLAPYLETSKKQQEFADWAVANEMNAEEAESADAVYDCQCCFTGTTFEHLAACTSHPHLLCNICIRRAVTEALFGQGWAQNIDHHQGLLKCLAPSSHESCDGTIPHYQVERALAQSKGGKETWNVLQSRLTAQALAASQLPMVKCPFCSYAEIDELYLPSSAILYRPNTAHLWRTFVMLMITFNFIPLVILYSLLCRLTIFQNLPTVTQSVSTSCSRLTRAQYLPQRFQCRSTACGLSSCLRCLKFWRDPHICHESAALSLRATVESARTAALKRTCPRCSLAFIKESGCNKLTCICGYSMCYICRQGLGKGEGGEGYRHFCQHFRPLGGICQDCDKCDLYKDLDDDEIVMTAGIEAEKAWREKEGMVGVNGIAGSQIETPQTGWHTGKWTIQALVDCWVGSLITC